MQSFPFPACAGRAWGWRRSHPRRSPVFFCMFSLSRSPLERCFMPKCLMIRAEIVPLPEPGGPMMTARSSGGGAIPQRPTGRPCRAQVPRPRPGGADRSEESGLQRRRLPRAVPRPRAGLRVVGGRGVLVTARPVKELSARGREGNDVYSKAQK